MAGDTALGTPHPHAWVELGTALAPSEQIVLDDDGATERRVDEVLVAELERVEVVSHGAP